MTSALMRLSLSLSVGTAMLARRPRLKLSTTLMPMLPPPLPAVRRSASDNPEDEDQGMAIRRRQKRARWTRLRSSPSVPTPWRASRLRLSRTLAPSGSPGVGSGDCLRLLAALGAAFCDCLSLLGATAGGPGRAFF